MKIKQLLIGLIIVTMQGIVADNQTPQQIASQTLTTGQNMQAGLAASSLTTCVEKDAQGNCTKQKVCVDKDAQGNCTKWGLQKQCSAPKGGECSVSVNYGNKTATCKAQDGASCTALVKID